MKVRSGLPALSLGLGFCTFHRLLLVEWVVGDSQLTVLSGTQRPISEGNRGKSSLEPSLPLPDVSIFPGWPTSAQLLRLMPGKPSCWVGI